MPRGKLADKILHYETFICNDLLSKNYLRNLNLSMFKVYKQTFGPGQGWFLDKMVQLLTGITKITLSNISWHKQL